MYRLALRAALLLPLALVTLACDDDGGGVRCSFDNPPVFDARTDSWTKFRRDLQNTGTIVLDAAGYARIAADPNDATEREAAWIYPGLDAEPEAAFVGSPSLNPAGDILYIGSTAGRLIGIHASGDDAGTLVRIEPDDESNGDEARDEFATADPFSITTTPLVATRDDKDAVFIGAANARLFGVSGDGLALEQVWPAALDTAIGSSSTLGDNGTIYTGTLGVGLYGTCPNGVSRYFITAGSTVSAPALGRVAAVDEDEDEIVYFGGDDGTLRAVREDGVVQWRLALSAPVLTAPVVVLDDSELTEAIYAVDATGRVVRVAPNGRVESGFNPPTDIGRVLASPALATRPGDGARLYVAGLDSGIHALDAETGERVWAWDAGDSIESSPAVVVSADGDPVLVFATTGGALVYLRDAGTTAELVATYSPESGRPIVTSPAIGRDGTVYFGGLDGRVYAVR